MASEEREDGSGDERDQMEDDVVDSDAPRHKRNRKKFHFTIGLDAQLIRFVMTENPYAHTGKDTITAWENVARRMDEVAGTTDLLPRTCRDRLERLLAYLEQDSPLLKVPSDFAAENEDRVALLHEVAAIRAESAKRSGQPVTPLRVKPRMTVVKTESPGRVSTRRTHRIAPAPYRSERSSLTNGGDHGAPTMVIGYPSNTDSNGGDPETRSATMVIDVDGVAQAQTGDEAEHEPSNEHVVIEGGHLSQLERSLITELLEYRKLEADRRKEELQVRREEIALQTRKLEQQTKQWAEEKADREARLALEKEERQLVIALLRKVLVPNGTG